MSTLKWCRSNARALHLSGMARLLWFRVDGAMKFLKNEDENKTNHWIILFMQADQSWKETKSETCNWRSLNAVVMSVLGVFCLYCQAFAVPFHSAEWKWWSQYTNIAPFAQTLWVSPGAGDRNLAWMPKSITLTYDNGIAGWYNPIF